MAGAGEEGRAIVSREDMVEQAVTDYARAAIFTERGYPSAQVEMLESFPYRLNEQQLTKNLIAAGFNFDDGGEQAELGSDLKRRVYTIQFFVFAMTATYGRNLANVLKFALDRDGQIPLKDVGQAAAPVIDYLTVVNVSAERQVIPDPEPWQEFCWSVHLRVADEYHAMLA